VSPDAERVQFETRDQWRTWLQRHHATTSGVWVITFKKAARKPTPSYEELVLEALCFGWIDGVAAKVDDERTSLYFCPRKKGSGWAATNKARIDRLTAEGLMTTAGQAVIDAAKSDGSWTRLDNADPDVVPRELATAMRLHPGSRKHFDAFPPGVRRQLNLWVADAKKPETKARRADEVARLAQQNIRANQWTPKQP
jgi:uncharacterized protein YdeI (YjbR/CyaY-like superfamily)